MGGNHPGRPFAVPAERTSFVGRRGELTRVRELLTQARLVTLLGTGGVGKTRLALRVAAVARRWFPDGVALADLAAVQDPALVAAQVAAALDVRDVTGRWLVGGLAEVVGDRRVLLVLDNCEHLRDACAVLADALLTACPHLRVLATSRHPLDIDAETVVQVPPLPAPQPDADGDIAGYESVQLLLQRARATAPTLTFADDDVAVLGELCWRLDGLPLAIELAAVRLRTLEPRDLLARLDDRFTLLRRSGSGTSERHRTLRATLEWSYDLLSEQERSMWRRAAVFSGPFGVEAAEAVCADVAVPARDVLDLLGRLVETSLLEVVRGQRHGTRYRMLETVRAFGRELLAGDPDGDLVRARHRDWCARLAATASRELVGPRQVAVLDQLEADHAELSRALDDCAETPGAQDLGLAIAADLWLYWQARGHLGAARRRLDALLAGASPQAPDRARALAVSGFLALSADDPGTGVRRLTEARDLAETTGAALVHAFATEYLGLAALFQGDLVRADALLREAADRLRALCSPHLAFCLADIGITAWFAGSYPSAAAALEESLHLSRAGDPWTRSHALWGLALVRLRTGDPAEAARLGRQALELMREVDDRSGVARCVEALAWAAAAQEDWDRAARLTGAADAVWRSIPAELPVPLRRHRDAYTEQVQRAIGCERWDARREEGSGLDRGRAISLALREPAAERRAAAQQPPGDRATLTRRQQEVAGLVAQGLTDREIAARLVVSTRTAEYHVEQILSRLGFRSRAEIAAWTVARHRS